MSETQKNTNPNNNPVDELESSIARNEKTLDTINNWVNNADTKVSILCGVFSAVFAVIAFFAERYLISSNTIIANKNVYSISILLLSLAAVSFLISILLNVIAISPHFSGKSKKSYSIFYENIKEFDSVDEYSTCAKAATDEMYNDELMAEIYYNSRICSKKMHRYKLALWFSFSAIILAILGCILLSVAQDSSSLLNSFNAVEIVFQIN